MAIMINLTDEQAEALGEHIVLIMNVKRSMEYRDRFETSWGTKTLTGIGHVVARLVNEVQEKQS